MKQLIARLRELEAAATPGPWWSGAGGHILGLANTTDICLLELTEGRFKDAELVTEMRNALPQLLDRLEKLERVVEAAQHFIDHRNTPTEDYLYNCGVAECDLEDALAALKEDK